MRVPSTCRMHGSPTLQTRNGWVSRVSTPQQLPRRAVEAGFVKRAVWPFERLVRAMEAWQLSSLVLGQKATKRIVSSENNLIKTRFSGSQVLRFSGSGFRGSVFAADWADGALELSAWACRAGGAG
jgi:hypothetical protein